MVWWEPVNSAIPSNKRGEVSFAALTTLPANLENEKYNNFSIISQSLNSTISLHCSPLNNRSTNWREKDFDLLPWVTKVGTDSRTPCATGIATWNRNQGVVNMPMTMKITMIIIWSQRQWSNYNGWWSVCCSKFWRRKTKDLKIAFPCTSNFPSHMLLQKLTDVESSIRKQLL